ncbi:carbamoyl-phosphate synthase large subunit [Candidatus Gracilibacteria bacterium]|nr:carbamoyl-phosphate synthase large subunit [Candidatus Gracilibacteria bacterium]MCF7819433.1 carbamoyl-phosphate synthase large subunit [Candidatus Gracilibacteria bacterium]
MKILLLGSGALKIGEAGEFDYSGSQAIKVFQRNGHEVILINPNIATIQTDPASFHEKGFGANKVYFLPVTPLFVEKVIQQEKPDALALSFGGQTALNCGLKLKESGILKKYKVRVLGTPVDVIQATEDREIFKQKLKEISILTPRSISAYSLSEAKRAAKKIGFPLIIRAGFALGGQGSGFCENEKKFEQMVSEALVFSPQVLVEEDLRGWKEIEYEVVRDSADNAITVVNMENFDPLGIHTGESIVISPSMTLANTEYQLLRTVSIKTIRHLGIVGECNIQFALNPDDDHDYRVIEVNARLSRSSALASKASGYPLAAVAADIILGKTMPEIPNAITKVTTSFFEPALDYLAVKIPRWDLQKFRKVSQTISTEMKSVGEVMALGRNFPECVQKAVRMLNIGSEGVLDSPAKFRNKKELQKNIEIPSPLRIFAVSYALWKKKFSIEQIYQMTKIDRWFLQQLKRITDCAQDLEKKKLTPVLLEQAKVLGFSDPEIARLTGKTSKTIRQQRKKAQIIPVTKQIDTLAAEFPAQTNYLYTTYLGKKNDI